MGDEDVTSISGAWLLDLDRSDTMEGYLRCLNKPDVAIEAQHIHASRNVIALDNHRLTIHKETRINNFIERAASTLRLNEYRFILDQEKVIPTRLGLKRCKASLREGGHVDGFVIATNSPTTGGRVELLEARQLIHGGRALEQVLHVRNLTTGQECVTRRTWIRLPMTDADHARVIDE